MEKDKSFKDKSTPENFPFKSRAEATKALADLAKKVLETGKMSEEITNADQESTSEYLSTLKEILHAINQEIKDCTNTDERLMLYKQREDVMNRMKEEKENQRHYHENREDKNRSHSRGIFAVVATVAVGAGGYAAKVLLENKRN